MDERIKKQKQEMIRKLIDTYGLESPKVLTAMMQVPREEFVEDKFKDQAYEDTPLPIGGGQIISQPYTVAFMTHILGLKGDEKVLEIGTGSGYQAAVLSKLAKQVYSVEVVRSLAISAKKKLKRLGYDNIEVKHSRGEKGWAQKTPFDRIIITAGMEEDFPTALYRQLADPGIMVGPVGKGIDKTMIKIKMTNGRLEREEFGIFRFVPFVEE